MKTTYRHNNTEARARLIILVIIALLGFLILLYTPLRNGIAAFFSPVSSSVWSEDNSVKETTGGFWGVFQSKSALSEENAKLHDEILRIQAQVLDRNLLAERVGQLEERLKRVNDDNRVLANVLVSSGRISYDMLVVDVGSNLGVHVGDRVVYAGAGVIGTVVEAYEATSKIKLFSSPNEETRVSIGKESIPALARGKGIGNFEVILPQGVSVKVGDEVIIPGTMFVLGYVGSVENNQDQPLSKILFRSPFNTTSIATVEIVLGDSKI